jgi:putative phosphoesterase
MPAIQKVGVISDTHGLLRPEALRALQGSDLIIHAGDVGDPKILQELSRLAPVVAVRGNIDTSGWSADLPETAVTEVGSALIYVLHDVKALDDFLLGRDRPPARQKGLVRASRLSPQTAGIAMVVSGHSHKPLQKERDGIIYLNPGSAGPRRFNLPVTLVRIDVARKPWRIEFVELVPSR